jgi:hypothetical protein
MSIIDLDNIPQPEPEEPTMPFGKHKGRKLSEINTHYLDWVLGLDNIRPELNEAIVKELSKRQDWAQMDEQDKEEEASDWRNET